MNHKEKALISVLIPVYCGENYLANAIDSVLAQSYQNLELIIVDNASTDRTREVALSYSDPRIRYVRHAENIGPERNWNACLEMANGRYFKLLPHDDLLEPDCLLEQAAVLESDLGQEIALVFGSRKVIDHFGRKLMLRGNLASGPRRIGGAALVRKCIRAGTNLIGEPGNVLMRTSLIPRLGGYSAENAYMIDLDFWFRVLRHGDAYFTGTPTSSFRVSYSSWTAAIGRAQYRDFKEFVARFARDGEYRISKTDVVIGLARARLNTLARQLVFHLAARGA